MASGTQFLNPDYAKLAESCHCKGISVGEYSELMPAVQEALAHDGPVIVDCHVDPDALMIPPAVTPHMALNYMKSEIKGWFAPPTDEIKHLASQAEAESKAT